MAIYDVKRLLTTAHCDAALKTISAAIENLKYKKAKCQRRLETHQRVVSKAQLELSCRKTALEVLTSGLSKLPAGERLARKHHCEITKTQWRIQWLELRLEDYSEQARLTKELNLHQAEAALEEAEALIAQLQARRAELQGAQATENHRQPAALVKQIPMVPLSAPPPNGKHPAKPPTIARLKQKRRGKLWVTTTKAASNCV